ncbi:MAG: hypothetical protein ACXADB_07820 [Candidatus Hermodarchaeia archaeon]|jgi:hypothetical protein
MFGFYSPDPFDELGEIAEPEITRSIDEVEIGTIWKSRDNSLWRVTYKNNRIHLSSLSGSKMREYGADSFFSTFSVVEFGAVCYLCKKEYPYAEKRHMFKCWACKNGA